jgi:hypothetical protein
MALSLSHQPLLTPHQQGKERAQIKFFSDRYTKLYDKGFYLTKEMYNFEVKTQKRLDSSRLTFMVITLGFVDTFSDYVTINDLIRKRISNNRWLQFAYWAWEWGEFSTHPHVHILCKYNKRPSHIVRELAKACKIPENFVDVKRYPEGCRKNRMAYIQKNFTSDTHLRSNYNLKNLYSYLDSEETGYESDPEDADENQYVENPDMKNFIDFRKNIKPNATKEEIEIEIKKEEKENDYVW